MSQSSQESRDAFVEVKESGKEATQVEQILKSLRDAGPGTANEVAQRTGLSVYVCTKRRGLMLRQGVIAEQLPRRCKVTGMNARPVQITDAGRDVLEGSDAPIPAPSRREHEAAVIRAARDLCDVWRPIPEPPAGIRKLLDAVWNLDNAPARHRAGKTVEKEPWGSPRRVALAARGHWLRANGDEVSMSDMTDPHLRGAIAWCIDNGQSWEATEQPLRALAEEQARRGAT